jgi:uncharacterized membrane protein YccC
MPADALDAEATARPERLGRRAVSAALRRRTELRHAVRVSVAVGACFLLVGQLLHLPQGYWAVFTTVIVVQTSVGGTITASLERLQGTMLGAVIGVAAAYLKARTVLEEGLVLAGAVAVCAFLAAVRPAFRVAPVTVAIVLVGGSTHMDPMVAAIWRVVEIVIGGLVGIAATLFIFPARAKRTVRERAGRCMELTADLLSIIAAGLKGREIQAELHRSHQQLRKALTQVEQAVGEAERESASGLRQAAAPEGLARSLWRVRNDAVMVGRALAQPLPPAVAEPLAPCAAALLEAVERMLRSAAGAVREGKPAALDPIARPRAAFEEAVERVRRARLTSDMTFDPAARVFGLVFALESLLGNLHDLADRVGEMADGPQVRPASALPA